jgi:DNA-binding NarL/FixJ family response regulator
VAGGLAEAHATVALIAEEGPRESVAEILQEQGVRFTAFDEVDDLFERPVDDCLSLVLLWIEDTISSPAGLIEPLRQRIERVPVVVICAGIRRWEVRAALAAGAAGVVLEAEMACALRPCLQAVQSGLICVPRQHWRQIEPPALSSREKQILGLVVMGYMNSQIAERLFLAESTIKSHLSSAFGKLGVRSRHEAVDLILDSERGLGMGILALGGEPLERTRTVQRTPAAAQ